MFLLQFFTGKYMFKNLLVAIILTSTINAQSRTFYGSNLNSFFSSSECCEHNKITVSGQGSASGLPDIAKVEIGFEVKGTTSQEAVNELTPKIRRAISTILAYGLTQDSYNTLSLNVRPEYNFIGGRSQIVGYFASQYLQVTVDDLDGEGTRVSRLVDQLARIDGLEIRRIQFDIEDKTDLQTLARERAFKDAELKAQDYAQFSGRSVGRALVIEDFVRVQAAPQPFIAQAKFASASVSADTSIQVGQLDVNYQVTVTFQLLL